jgi:hypothetical protein
MSFYLPLSSSCVPDVQSTKVRSYGSRREVKWVETLRNVA